jgi:VWFA-related protein
MSTRLHCRRQRGAAIIGVLLSLAALLGAQEQSPTFRGGTDLVTLDVSVIDKDRHPVKGLTTADFTVFEDGKPQPVVAFEAVDLPDAAAPSAPWLRDIAPDVVSNQHPSRRIVVIVMDDANTSSDIDVMEAVSARQIAHAVIDRLGEDDLAAVAFTDVGRWQNLTANRAQLAAAVDSFNPHPNSAPLDALQNAYRTDRAGLGGTTSPNPPPTCSYRGASHGVGACVIDALSAIAQGLSSAPHGRKTVVYIGNGIPYDFSMTDLRGWRNPGQDIVELQAMLRSLQESNINVYAFNLCGVKCGIFGSQQDWLRVVTEETGGLATLGTNAPEAGVQQVFVENSSYYLMGFRPSNRTADGKFRRIEVKVNRPGVDLHTRSGYYAPLPEKARAVAKRAPPPAVDLALGQAVPGGSLPLAMTVAPIAMRGSQAALAITVALLEPLPPGRHRVELVTTAVDASCPDCKRQSHRQTIEFIPASGANASAQTYEMISRLPIKPGRYNVRAAATLGGRSGTVFTDVEVGDAAKDPLYVSGLVMNVAPPAVTAQARLLSDLLPLLPSTARDLRPGMTATAFLRVTQGGSKPTAAVRLAATIRNETNEIDFQRATTIDASAFDATRSADYRLELPIATLAPGPHVLMIEISSDKSVVRRDARFTIK